MLAKGFAAMISTSPDEKYDMMGRLVSRGRELEMEKELREGIVWILRAEYSS